MQDGPAGMQSGAEPSLVSGVGVARGPATEPDAATVQVTPCFVSGGRSRG